MVVYPRRSGILKLNEIRYNVIVCGGGYVYHIILEQEDTGLGGERREINSCIKGSSGAK
jgi:hypothetical protein